MSKPARKKFLLPLDGSLFGSKPRKPVPFPFVLDAIAALSPWTRPMFGCLAIYIDEKIVLILRDKPSQAADNGVWLATTLEHHQSLRADFPHMRSIQVLGKKVTGWQVLPVDSPDFEEAALHACDLILANDPRIGKVPGTRRNAKSANRPSAKPTRAQALRKPASLKQRNPGGDPTRHIDIYSLVEPSTFGPFHSHSKKRKMLHMR